MKSNILRKSIYLVCKLSIFLPRLGMGESVRVRQSEPSVPQSPEVVKRGIGGPRSQSQAASLQVCDAW